MTVSVPVLEWWGSHADDPTQARVLLPHELILAGILGDPDHPRDAIRRARALLRQGRYAEAREMLTEHAKAEVSIYAPVAYELLAQSAFYSGSADARDVIDAAVSANAIAGDVRGVGRLSRLLGEVWLTTGHLAEAEASLDAASHTFQGAGESKDLALTEYLLAEVSLRRLAVEPALARVDAALGLPHGDTRVIALGRLARARLLAITGDVSGAAKDLLLAERDLGTSGGMQDHLRVRLARAEALLLFGTPERAAAGLLRLIDELAEIEEVATSAQAHQLLGEALLDADPAAARRHLMRGRHLYEGVGHTYGVAACDIVLGRVEHRLGLNPRGRLTELESNRGEWPWLTARLQIAHAEINAGIAPAISLNRLAQVEGLAIARRHESLVHEVGAARRHLGY